MFACDRPACVMEFPVANPPQQCACASFSSLWTRSDGCHVTDGSPAVNAIVWAFVWADEQEVVDVGAPEAVHVVRKQPLTCTNPRLLISNKAFRPLRPLPDLGHVSARVVMAGC
jgi:hypothetical protein